MNVTKTDAQSAAALALAGMSNSRGEQLMSLPTLQGLLAAGRGLLGDLSDQAAGEQIIALFGSYVPLIEGQRRINDRYRRCHDAAKIGTTWRSWWNP